MEGIHNQQQLLAIKGMFGIKQVSPIVVDLEEKYDKIPCKLEVIPSGDFVTFRAITLSGTGLWDTWENPEQVENYFRTASL